MYDTYSRYIYEWLTNTFLKLWKEDIGLIINTVSSICMLIEYILYVGIFAFLFWVLYTILKPHLFKI